MGLAIHDHGPYHMLLEGIMLTLMATLVTTDGSGIILESDYGEGSWKWRGRKHGRKGWSNGGTGGYEVRFKVP